MRILLDKGVIRRLLEGFVRGISWQPLTKEQETVSELLRKYYGKEQLYMSYKSFNTLKHRFGHLEIVQLIFSMSGILYPTRYARRWARRLRKFGFGREDALMISMGSFSTDKPYKGKILGVNRVVTLDKRMYERFQNNYSEINTVFEKMVTALEAPFSLVKLPEIEIPN
jgi:hypothetical protein